MNEEEQLRMALEASLQEDTCAPSGRMGLIVETLRSCVHERQDKHKLSSEIEGVVMQYNTIDQFGPLFSQAKKEHSTASAICGYLSCANALLIEKFVVDLLKSGGLLTLEKINNFASNNLSDFDYVLPEVLKCMGDIQENRVLYWKEHPEAKAPENYLKNWVANYEISDCVKGRSISGMEDTKDYLSPTTFVRYNQWPERNDATSDERARLFEEQRFGGEKNGKRISYDDDDSVYFLELFRNSQSSFYTPKEFKGESHTNDGVIYPRALIIDLNGHFVSALACHVDDMPLLYIFNTTAANYVSNNMAVAWSFDSMFDISSRSLLDPPHVALLGDSTLDNVVWVSDPATSVKCCLQRYLISEIHASSKVSNFAADGFTTRDVLNGGPATISYRARAIAGDPFPDSMTSDYTFCPLVALHTISKEDFPPTTIVLSVGGNDIRQVLNELNALPHVLQTLQSNYIKIVQQLRSEIPSSNLILMFQYRPSMTQELDYAYNIYSHLNLLPGPGNSAVEKLHKIMETLYAPIVSLAADMKLPIIDLPNSFDIYNDDLYSHQIEPSAVGGSLIAYLIGETIKRHDYSSSQFYSMNTKNSCQEAVSVKDNPCGQKWSINENIS